MEMTPPPAAQSVDSRELTVERSVIGLPSLNSELGGPSARPGSSPPCGSGSFRSTYKWPDSRRDAFPCTVREL